MKFFPFTVDRFTEDKKSFDRVASHKNISIRLNPSPAEPGYTLILQTV